jgi:hypothetical protein
MDNLPDSLPISVWAFDDAPVKYQEMSDHGGDEDWIVFLPYDSADLSVAERIVERLTVCDCDRYNVDGGVIWITAHD